MSIFDFYKKFSQSDEKNAPKRNDKYNLAMKEFESNKYNHNQKAKDYLQIAYEASNGHPLDRHYWYNAAIDYYYNLSKTEGYKALEKCKELCRESIEFTPKALEAFKEEYHGESLLDFIPPNVPAFKRLAVIYENEGNYSDAIAVCEEAISLGLRDGTPGGFEARKQKLEKKKIPD